MKESVSAVLQAYESTKFNKALNENLHIGGLDITERTAELAGLDQNTKVLDIACGRGTTACFLAEAAGSSVYGIDLSKQSILLATQKAAEQGVSHLVQFHVADALNLPFADEFFDVVICQCSFSLIESKQKAAAEIARVLKPGGKLGLDEIFLRRSISKELTDIKPFDCCFTRAETLDGYEKIFSSVNLVKTHFEDHSLSMADTSLLIKQEYGSLNYFWEMFGSDSVSEASCSCSFSYTGSRSSQGKQSDGEYWKKLFAEADPGYCLMIMEKSKQTC